MRENRKVVRLKEYDYSQAGGYFVTVCTYRRECLLGEIVHQEMKLSRPGEIVTEWWLRLKDRFPQKRPNVNGIKSIGYTIPPLILGVEPQKEPLKWAFFRKVSHSKSVELCRGSGPGVAVF